MGDAPSVPFIVSWLMAMKLGIASIQVFILARPQCNMLVISKMPVLIFSRIIHCFYSQRLHILPSYLYLFYLHKLRVYFFV